METWKGLWRKEWFSMKGWLYAIGIIILLIILGGSLGLSFLTEEQFNAVQFWGSIIVLGLMVFMFFPLSLLLNSLWREWKYPDIWLHSPGSIFQLFGSKVCFAMGAGAVYVGIPGMLAILYAAIFGSPFEELSLGGLATFVVRFTVSMYIAACLFMLIGLFFAVLHEVVKSYVKGWAKIITAVLFIAAAWLFNKVVNSSFYKIVSKLGPIGNPDDVGIHIERGNFYINQTESAVYMGSIVITLLFAGFLFVAASLLFERKVRL